MYFFRYSFSISNVIQFAQLKLLNPLLLLWIPNGKSNWPVHALLLLLLLKMRHKSSNVKVKRRISHWTTMKNLAPSMPMCCCVDWRLFLSTVNSHTYCRPLTCCHFTNWNCHAKPMPRHAQLVFPSFMDPVFVDERTHDETHSHWTNHYHGNHSVFLAFVNKSQLQFIWLFPHCECRRYIDEWAPERST